MKDRYEFLNRYKNIQSPMLLLQEIFKYLLSFLDLTIAQNERCYGQIDRSRHF